MAPGAQPRAAPMGQQTASHSYRQQQLHNQITMIWDLQEEALKQLLFFLAFYFYPPFAGSFEPQTCASSPVPSPSDRLLPVQLYSHIQKTFHKESLLSTAFQAAESQQAA